VSFTFSISCTIYFYVYDIGFCRNPQFNSDFPKQLSGIIDPDEFQQSIDNINRACRPTLCENLLVLCLFLCSLVGLIVFIAGISVIWLSVSALWIPLMSIGFVLFMGFFITAILVSSQIYRLCDTRLDKAIDAESRKYSMKLPVPTRWRLDMTIYTRHNSDAGPTYIQYFVSNIILTGRVLSKQSIVKID
jgi:hypothetical protein